MNEMKNPTSGIADPYWYEWTVGLNCAVDMLNSDNNIESVTLQATDLQGLDDVVVKYSNGSVDCIQVKHTREEDQLSFSDIIANKNGQSYLSKFAKDWKKLNQEVIVNKVVLYTNRNINNSANNRNNLYRPGLKSFLEKLNEQINTVTVITDFIFPKEWEKAWERVLSELDILANDEQKLSFLKVLEIQTSQPDLLELKKMAISKIESSLHSNVHISEKLFDKLVVALFNWTTTHREKEEIFLEDLYEALSIESYDFKGVVSLPTTEPFIDSRVKFCEHLESKILSTDKKVIFLSGEAGSGKTNVASFLVNKISSIISLRYYTFKPLNLQSDYLSADRGGSNPRTLWGDLLLQLKEKLKGNLATYNIPMSIEFIDSTDHLRKEVIRLAEVLSTLNNQKTIILIDGIDHAARSGQNSNFLETLLPPDLIPENICFLIIGQPIKDYTNYPTWLNDNSVLKMELPPITVEDVESLCEYSKIVLNDTEGHSLANFIHHNTNGNILLSIFLIHESQKYSSLNDFEKILQTKNISQGLNLYYDYIWRSAISELGDDFKHLEKIVAGIFSLINKGINVKDLKLIFPDIDLETFRWKSILDKVFPLIVEREGQYNVFHNDFRIYLQKILEQDSYTLKEVSSYLADFLLNRCLDIPLKHGHIFCLLAKAQRQNEFFEIMSPEFIKDAIEYLRPLEELEEQIVFCIDYINENFDIHSLFKLSLSISTLNQFLQSNQWAEINYAPSLEHIALRDSEKYFYPLETLNIDAILGILNDVLFFIRNNEESRGNELIHKWFGTMNPLELIKLLEIPEIKEIDEDRQDLLYKFGYINSSLNREVKIEIESSSDKYEKLIVAYYSKGCLAHLSKYKYDDIEQKLKNISIFFKQDYEDFIIQAIKFYPKELILFLIQKQDYKDYSLYTLLQIYFWAIKLNCIEDISPIKSIILDSKLDSFKEEAYFDRSFKPILLLVIARSYENEEYKVILEEFKNLNFSRLDIQLEVHSNYLQVAHYIGRLYNYINSQRDIEDTTEFHNHLIKILNPDNLTIRINHFNMVSATNWLLEQLNGVKDSLPREFENELIKILTQYIENHENILYLEFIWTVLKEYGEYETLSKLYSYWMDNEGKVWGLEFAELQRISNLFLDLAEDVIDSSRILASNNILSSKIIGYVGRKEYSLFNLLEWFEIVSYSDPSIWKREGIEMLNINNIASELGDNRAAIYLVNAISKAAMNCGPNDFNIFINLDSRYNHIWKTTIFDSIISAMKDHTFTDDECDLIIEAAIRAFPCNESFRGQSFYKLNCIYLTDVRDAIIATKTRINHSKYIEKIEKQYPDLFKLPQMSREAYRIEERFFIENKSNTKFDIRSGIDVQQIIELIKENHFEKDKYINFNELLGDIENISSLISRKNERLLYNSLYHLIRTRDNNPWFYDGVDRIYKHILSCIDEEYKKQIFSNIIQVFRKPNQSLESKIYSLASDVESYIIAYCKGLPLEKKKAFLNALIDMHKVWITGYNTISIKTKYEFNSPDTTVENWLELFGSL